jgi:hypothetical protein
VFLTDSELSDLTGLQRASAQARWLAARGYRYEVSAVGRIRVLRMEVERRMLSRSAAERRPRLDLIERA